MIGSWQIHNDCRHHFIIYLVPLLHCLIIYSGIPVKLLDVLLYFYFSLNKGTMWKLL